MALDTCITKNGNDSMPFTWSLFILDPSKSFWIGTRLFGPGSKKQSSVKKSQFQTKMFWTYICTEHKKSSFHSHFITTTHVTTPFQQKRFEKGFLAEIYSLCASERLLIYLHPIFSHKKSTEFNNKHALVLKYLEVRTIQKCNITKFVQNVWIMFKFTFAVEH